MMKCPHCQKNLAIEDRHFLEVTKGLKSLLVKAPCCGRGVWIEPVMRVQVKKYGGQRKKDSFGQDLIQ